MIDMMVGNATGVYKVELRGAAKQLIVGRKASPKQTIILSKMLTLPQLKGIIHIN